ncbi:MAG: hypothetical protein J5919_01585 [Clostridia bacterium]|nr:hypothetical protein [Clostridia bacterium]
MNSKGYRFLYRALAFFGILFLISGALVPEASIILQVVPSFVIFAAVLVLQAAGYFLQSFYCLVRKIKRPESGGGYESENRFYRFSAALPVLLTGGCAAAWAGYRTADAILSRLGDRPGMFYDSYSLVPYLIAASAFIAVAAGSFSWFFPYDRLLTGKAAVAGLTVSAAFSVLWIVGSGTLSLVSGLCFAGYAVTVQLAMNQSNINRSYRGAAGAKLDGRARGYNLTLTLAVISIFAVVAGAFYVLLSGLFTLLRLLLAVALVSKKGGNDSELSMDSEERVSLIGDFIFNKRENAKYHSGKAYLFIFIAFMAVVLFLAVFGRKDFMKRAFSALKTGVFNLIVAIFGPIADFLSPSRDVDGSVYYVDEEKKLQPRTVSAARKAAEGEKRRNWPDFVSSLKQKRTAEDKYRFAYSQMVSIIAEGTRGGEGGVKPSDTPREIAERLKKDGRTATPGMIDMITDEFERIEFAEGTGASQEAFDSVCDIIINKIS